MKTTLNWNEAKISLIFTFFDVFFATCWLFVVVYVGTINKCKTESYISSRVWLFFFSFPSIICLTILFFYLSFMLFYLVRLQLAVMYTYILCFFVSVAFIVLLSLTLYFYFIYLFFFSVLFCFYLNSIKF